MAAFVARVALFQNRPPQSFASDGRLTELFKVSDTHTREIASIRVENTQLKARLDKAEPHAANQEMESDAKIKSFEQKFEGLEKSFKSR